MEVKNPRKWWFTSKRHYTNTPGPAAAYVLRAEWNWVPAQAICPVHDVTLTNESISYGFEHNFLYTYPNLFHSLYDDNVSLSFYTGWENTEN